MKNKLIYGGSGTGKTYMLKHNMFSWKGKIISISFFNDKKLNEQLGLKVFDLNKEKFCPKEILSTNKIFLLANTNNREVNSQTIKDLVLYLNENVNKFNDPLLIVIDEFTEFDLREKINEKSILLSLLSLQNYSVYSHLAFQDFNTFTGGICEDEEKSILKLCDVINTKELESYSGELRVRFPRSLHKYLAEKSKDEGVSLNQYIIYLLTKAMSYE